MQDASDTHSTTSIAPLQEVVKPAFVFKQTYRDANVFSKMLFHYAGDMISAVNKNGGKMTDDVLISMCQTEDETQQTTDYF